MFLQAPLAPSTLVVAIDPGKVMNRVWVSDGEGPVAEPSRCRSRAPVSRHCLVRQGAGRAQAEETAVDELRAVVRHRRCLITDRTKAQQRLHDQLNALAPGLSAPAPHGRALPIESPTGQAVLACAVTFAGRPPSVRSLIARAPGRLTHATAQYWQDRWRGRTAGEPDD